MKDLIVVGFEQKHKTTLLPFSVKVTNRKEKKMQFLESLTH